MKPAEKKGEEFMQACRVAADLIRKGLAPPLAIWKTGREYGIDHKEIAAEIGKWKKKKKEEQGADHVDDDGS